LDVVSIASAGDRRNRFLEKKLDAFSCAGRRQAPRELVDIAGGIGRREKPAEVFPGAQGRFYVAHLVRRDGIPFQATLLEQFVGFLGSRKTGSVVIQVK